MTVLLSRVFRRWKNRFVHAWEMHGTARRTQWNRNGMVLTVWYLCSPEGGDRLSLLFEEVGGRSRRERCLHANKHAVAARRALVLTQGQGEDCRTLLPKCVQTRAAMRSLVLDLAMSVESLEDSWGWWACFRVLSVLFFFVWSAACGEVIC